MSAKLLFKIHKCTIAGNGFHASAVERSLTIFLLKKARSRASTNLDQVRNICDVYTPVLSVCLWTILPSCGEPCFCNILTDIRNDLCKRRLGGSMCRLLTIRASAASFSEKSSRRRGHLGIGSFALGQNARLIVRGKAFDGSCEYLGYAELLSYECKHPHTLLLLRHRAYRCM